MASKKSQPFKNETKTSSFQMVKSKMAPNLSKTWSFHIRPTFDCSKSGHIWMLDPHCGLWFKTTLNFFFRTKLCTVNSPTCCPRRWPTRMTQVSIQQIFTHYKYIGELNTGQVWFSNGRKYSEWWIVHVFSVNLLCKEELNLLLKVSDF